MKQLLLIIETFRTLQRVYIIIESLLKLIGMLNHARITIKYKTLLITAQHKKVLRSVKHVWFSRVQCAAVRSDRLAIVPYILRRLLSKKRRK